MIDRYLDQRLADAARVRIAELAARGGPTDAERRSAIAAATGENGLATCGEALLHGGRRGEPARLFNAMAQGIAILAFAPGGVDAFGDHFEA